MEPNPGLYRKHECITAAQIHHVNYGQPFKVLIANFTKNPVKFNAQQVVTTTDDYQDIIVELNMTHAEMLEISTTTYTKRDKNVRDVDTVNKHLADARLATLGNQEEITITSENVEIHAPKEYHPRVRALLHKHEDLWSGELRNPHGTNLRIDLIPGTTPFKYAPYGAGQKACEPEEFEIKSQLAAGVIEHSNAEWAAPVLFAPKKDGLLRLCIDYRKINTMNTKDSYPLPRIDECIDSLDEDRIFSTLVAFNGYWQITWAKNIVTRHHLFVSLVYSNTCEFRLD